MNKELYSNLVCALTHNIDVCEHCKKCDKTGADARIKLVEELAKETGYEVPWISEDFQNKINSNIKEDKKLLTKEEINYLEDVLKPYKDRATAIILEEGLFGYPEGYGFIRIRLNDPNIIREGLEDMLILPTFKIGTQYKNLQPGKEYTLEELNLFKEN